MGTVTGYGLEIMTEVRGPGSSVGTVTGYGLEIMTEVRGPG